MGTLVPPKESSAEAAVPREDWPHKFPPGLETVRTADSNGPHPFCLLQGVRGMRVGGLRKLILPAELVSRINTIRCRACLMQLVYVGAWWCRWCKGGG
jgi:hypothetical protein